MFTAALLIIAKNCKQIKCPSMDKYPVAHPYKRICSSIKENELLLIYTT